MAAATIHSLTDELLVAIFKRVPGYLPRCPELRNRLGLEAVCRRWRAVAASPAAAPEFAVQIVQFDGNADEAAAAVKVHRWFAVHGARVRELKLGLLGAQDLAWAAALPVLALAPALRAATLWLSGAAPAGAEWWRHLAPSLTQLTLGGRGSAAIDGVDRRVSLPPALERVAISAYGLRRAPPSLGDLARLTRLAMSGLVDGAMPAAFWEVLPRLAALQDLDLSPFFIFIDLGRVSALPAVPTEVGALSRLTRLRLAADYPGRALGAPGALDPLARLPRLARLELASGALRQPSALARLTALTELGLVVDERSLLEAGEQPLVEPGPHLARLRRLDVVAIRDGGVAPATNVDVRRRLVEPLRAATALTALGFWERGGGDCAPPSLLLLTVDRVDDLVAGKPALREFRASQVMLVAGEVPHHDALRARHPRVDFLFVEGEGGRWFF